MERLQPDAVQAVTFSYDPNAHLDVRELQPGEHAVRGGDGVWYVEGESVSTFGTQSENTELEYTG